MLDEFPGLYVNLSLGIGLLLLLRNISNQHQMLRFIFAGFAIFLNLRYFSWRFHATMNPFMSNFESTWQWCFFAAEVIAITSLSWHFIVLAWKPRAAIPPEANFPTDNENAPEVDVFIPTYNEGATLLEPTIQAAIGIDYPNLNIYVLDDGDRDWLRTLCSKYNVHYIRRKERTAFKSGNLNNALTKTHGRYILCIDADFTVRPQILKRILGYFNDPKIGIVQTPQHFRNPDAIQHNLAAHHAWPEEQRVFTDSMQPCRDNWDNAFCYGSNFVIRRDYLDAIDGFPTESICEDLLLTYKLKKMGWITRFHSETLAEGEAANTLSEFINQRIRWCAGTLQCLFIKDGPIRSTKLSPTDRLFFLDSIFYYLTTLWFFLILISPAIFWWFGIAPFQADNGHILMMLAPRVLVSMIVLYWLTNRKVVPIVSEIGRYVSIFQILRTTVTTLIRPSAPTFRVTEKNNTRTQTTINWAIARPHLLLAGVTLAGIIRTLLFGIASESGLNENIGLIFALTAFSLWVTFISILTCIEPPLNASETSTTPLATEGSLGRSIRALAKKITQ